MKSLDEMTFEEKVSWACGTILIGIGEGKFRSSVADVLLAINHEAFQRGERQVKKAPRGKKPDPDAFGKTCDKCGAGLSNNRDVLCPACEKIKKVKP